MIFVTGDIHGEVGRLDSSNFRQASILTKEDFVIILGDFGLIWERQQQPQERLLLEWLSAQPFTTLFLDGNHENFDRLLAYETTDFCGGKASQIHDSVYYLRRGEIYVLDGKKCFVMGGAMSTDKERRIVGKSWWKQEEPDYADWDRAAENILKHSARVDYVFTHTAPVSIAAELLQDADECSVEVSKLTDPVAGALERLRKEVAFDQWLFGHFHCSWTNGRFTVLYEKIICLKNGG